MDLENRTQYWLNKFVAYGMNISSEEVCDLLSYVIKVSESYPFTSNELMYSLRDYYIVNHEIPTKEKILISVNYYMATNMPMIPLSESMISRLKKQLED